MKKKNTLHIIFNSALLLCIVAAFSFFSLFAVTFVQNITAQESDLGTGISAALSLVFMVIIGIAEIALGVIGAVWSGMVRKGAIGGVKRAMTAFFVSDIVLPAVSAITTAVLIILNNLGVF